MNNELVDRIDRLISAYTGGGKISSSMSVIKIMTDCKAALSEPVYRACGNGECNWSGKTERMCGKIGPLCPECGETTEPVASAPQDVEGFIVENELPAFGDDSKVFTFIRTATLRAWMAGHARVPSDYIDAVEKAIRTICNNAAEKLNELAPDMGWDSGEVTAETHLKFLMAMLTASKERME